MGFKQVTHCRICRNPNLAPVLDLGEQLLTGVFPRSTDQPITRGPLRLVKCVESSERSCGLVQLQHSFELHEMFGENYGYRSGLNASMVEHLHDKVNALVRDAQLQSGDLILDIGSNDATTLKGYPERGLDLVGIDPTAGKFKAYYPDRIQLVSEFFSSSLFKSLFGDRRAKVVTSFSMFYDLEDPMQFMREVHEVLASDGIWLFEQSYMPTMLVKNSYDTVCHEHIEYYALQQIKWMADRVGFVLSDVNFNEINGGSFSVAARKRDSGARESPVVRRILENERALGLNTERPFQEFARRVVQTKEGLLRHIAEINGRGEELYALGASTKGNVLLQYCGLTRKEIPLVGEVNLEKCGRFTPGSDIPIIAEEVLMRMNPRHLLVLPWHFRDFFVASARFKGRNLVFPLPNVEIVALS